MFLCECVLMCECVCVCVCEIADIMSLSCHGSEHLDLISLGYVLLGCVVLG